MKARLMQLIPAERLVCRGHEDYPYENQWEYLEHRALAKAQEPLQRAPEGPVPPLITTPKPRFTVHRRALGVHLESYTNESTRVLTVEMTAQHFLKGLEASGKSARLAPERIRVEFAWQETAAGVAYINERLSLVCVYYVTPLEEETP